jgi:glycosyltransferase involved in cell wall biosynthesis
MQPKVSVIVPVYNVEPYLRRCLDSLVNQTLKDIEIICINDYSPDNSLIILKEYAEKDNRVKIINFEKNQGVSIARNAGIELAKGEYIGICDPDDYVDLNFYDKLYNKAKETEADMVKTGFKEKHIDWTKEYSRYASIKQNKYHDTFFHWCYIYKTDMLKRNQIRYPEDIRLSEDAFFLIKSLFYSKKIVIVHDVFYHYIRRECNAATSCFGEAIANSYGIPLIFDFMNKAVKDKNEYIDFFSAFFGKVLHLFTLAIPEYRKYVVRAAIDIYKNRQYSITLENLPEF